MVKPGLGKGLGALIGPRSATVPATTREEIGPRERIYQVSLASVAPSRLQPRKDFAPEALQELMDSIRQHGIIQPLIVRQSGGRYELIAGERRWRAAQELGLSDVPVIIRSANDLEVLELSLIENLQRSDLNAIEEAHGYARLAEEFGMTQEEIAVKVGRSRAAVANAMRLLDLPLQVQTWVAQGVLSVGHAKVLLGLKNHDEQRAAAETVLRRNLTVRSTERLVARQLGIPRRRKAPREQIVSSAAITDLQERLQRHLGTHVRLHHGESHGRIEIEYYGNHDLQRVVTAIGLPAAE
jgi:ParB family transcriptional regulator, chromosome partitioning protein